MTEHTPGPWRVNPLAYMRVNAANSNVARISREHGDIEGEANARLIAASPAMYEYIQRKATEGDANAQEIIDSIGGR